MAEKLSICGPRGVAIITGSGLIHKTLIGLRTPMTEARVSQSTAGKRGPPKITSRLRSFITFPWIMLSPTTFTARNRTIQVLELRVGQIGAQSGPQIGS